MRHIARIRVSPATALAAAALFVALAGTSVAAVSIAVPRHSVGTAQLRNGAVSAKKLRNGAVTAKKLRNGVVTSAKVRRHSLVARDFKVGQLPRGPAGPAGVAGPAGPRGPAGPAGPAGAAGADATTLWAVVNKSGSIARSSGTTSGGRLGPGDYEVIFKTDVSKCLYLAVVGSPTTGAASAGYATVGSRLKKLDGVEVATFAPDGTATDEPFHLAVFC